MKITFKKIQEFSSLEDISPKTNSLVFLGEGIDFRSRETIKYLNEKYPNNNIIKILYEYETNNFVTNGETHKKNILAELIKKLIDENNIGSIILESTSLGYAEILSVLEIINSFNLPFTITIIYVEPIKYKSNKKNLESEVYELSEDYHPHKYIKPFLLNEPHDSTSNEPASLITFVGFEENRLGRVLTQNNDDKKYDQFLYVLAVPGFQFGWENTSLSRHYHLLENHKDIYYSPADDPFTTYEILEKITENYPDKKIVVMPLGTKPCTIGSSIFLVNKRAEIKMKDTAQQIATKYDFPIKSKDRTSGISKVYEYILETK